MLLVWGPHFENRRRRLRQGRTEFFATVHILSTGAADKAVGQWGGGVQKTCFEKYIKPTHELLLT